VYVRGKRVKVKRLIKEECLLRRIMVLLLAIALICGMAAPVFAANGDGGEISGFDQDTDTEEAESEPGDEPEEEPADDAGQELNLPENEPEIEPGDENSGGQGEDTNGEIPVTMPSIAPDMAGGANPDTGEPPLLAVALAAGAAALAVLALALRKAKSK
jgi:hypothetical protein